MVDAAKGDHLLHQRGHEMEQHLALDGILERGVSSADGKEAGLGFAGQGDFESSNAAWRLNTQAPHRIGCVTRARVAKLPMPAWVAFIEGQPGLKATLEHQLMQLVGEIMARTNTLHLLDVPGRVHRFMRKHPELVGGVPK